MSVFKVHGVAGAINDEPERILNDAIAAYPRKWDYIPVIKVPIMCFSLTNTG